MERIEDEPAKPGTDNLSDDVHNATDDGHPARSHHADGDNRIQASARKSVDRNQNRDEREGVSSHAVNTHE